MRPKKTYPWSGLPSVQKAAEEEERRLLEEIAAAEEARKWAEAEEAKRL